MNNFINNAKEYVAPSLIVGLTSATIVKLLAGKSIFLIGALIPAAVSPALGGVIAIAAVIAGLSSVYLFAEKYKKEGKIILSLSVSIFVGTVLYGSVGAAATILIPAIAAMVFLESNFKEDSFLMIFNDNKKNTEV